TRTIVQMYLRRERMAKSQTSHSNSLNGLRQFLIQTIIKTTMVSVVNTFSNNNAQV
ncbi:hypothetical protein L9F63_005067, partial [Diploptera punctata]